MASRSDDRYDADLRDLHLAPRTFALVTIAFVALTVLTTWSARWFVLEGGYSVWWPPAGLTLGYLLLVGWRGAPIAAVTRVVALGITIVGWPQWSTLLRAVLITAAYLLAAELLRHTGLAHARLPELGWFVMIGVVAGPALAAFGATLVDILTDGLDALSASYVLALFIGDAIGVATITPAILTLTAKARSRLRPPLPDRWRDRAEAVAQALALVVVPIAASFLPRLATEQVWFLLVIVIPPIWIALRRSLLTAALGLVVVNTVLSAVARVRLGQTTDLADIQTLMLAIALAGLFAAVARRTSLLHHAALVEREARYRTLVTNAPEGVVRFDDTGTVEFAHDPITRIVRSNGTHHGTATGAGVPQGWIPDGNGSTPPATPLVQHLTDAWETFGPRALRGDTTSFEWTLEHEGRLLDLATVAVVEPESAGSGAAASVLAVTTDLSPLRAAQRRATAAAQLDILTGLPNTSGLRSAIRALLDAHPPAAMTPSAPTTPFAVVRLDLAGIDGLRLGSAPALVDLLIATMASRFASAISEDDLLTRLGDRGFAVLHTGSDPDSDPEPATLALARRMLDLATTPVALDGDTDVQLSASIGVAFSSDVTGVEDLMHMAAAVAGLARQSGGNRIIVGDPRLIDESERERLLLARLRRAIDNGEIVVHYQPIVAIGPGTARPVVGAEALVRWDHPDEGLLPPDRFLDSARRLGLIGELDRTVLRTALADAARWPRLQDRGLELSVNVTASDLAAPGYADIVIQLCEAHQFDPTCLELEITEDELMTDPGVVAAAVAALKGHGIHLALDDFGTGYSSLAWLQRLDIDTLKIDRSFTAAVADDPHSDTIVRAIVHLAHEFHLQVTAEGVETAAADAYMHGLGCARAQGWLYGRAVPADQFAALLA